MKHLLLLVIICLAGCSTVVPVKVKFPEAPVELLQQCTPLTETKPTTKLSDVISVVAENYSKYHECSLKNNTWIDWYNAQKKLFEELQ